MNKIQEFAQHANRRRNPFDYQINENLNTYTPTLMNHRLRKPRTILGVLDS